MKKAMMGRVRIILLVIMFVIVLVVSMAALGGCSQGEDGNGSLTAPVPDASEPAPTGEPDDSRDEPSGAAGIVITDMIGREVRLAGPAERIVALTAADVEVIFAIGAGGKLVGRGEYCNYPPEALDVPEVQSGNETNIEQIIALGPQLVIMSKIAQDENQIKQLEDAGIAVFVNDPQAIEEVYISVDLLGRLLGKEAGAAAVVQDMKDVFSELQLKASVANESAGEEKKSVYFEVSPIEFGLWTAGAGTFMNEVAELLGLRNTFGDVDFWAEISEEQVLERNPDYIMTVGMYFGDGPTPIESILSRPSWESITAVKNQAILNLTEDELSRPGPRLALGARLLYEFVYEGGTATPNA